MAGPWVKYQDSRQDEKVWQGATPLGFTNRAIAGVLGGPVDLLDWALQPLGLDSPVPLGGSESLRRGMEFIGAEVAPEGAVPTTSAQRGMEAVGAGVPMLLPGGAAVGLVRRGGGEVAKRVAGALAEPAIKAPAAFLGVEAGASYTAGAGGLKAERIAREAGIEDADALALARFGGEFLGGLAAVGAPTGAMQMLRMTPGGAFVEHAVLPAVAPFTKAGAARRVQKRVGGLVPDPGAIPGRIDEPTIAPLTPAQRTREPGLLALDRAKRESDPQLQERFADRNVESRRVLEEDLRRSGKGGSAEEAAAIIQKRRAGVEAKLLENLEQARDTARREIEALAPDQRATESSRIQVERLKSARNVARDEKTRLWGLVDDDDTIQLGGDEGPFSAYRKFLDQLEEPTLDDMPEVARRFLDPDSSNTVYSVEETVGRVRALRSALLKVAREDKNTGNRARIANGIAEALRKNLEDPSISSEGVSKALIDARLWTFEYHRIYEQGNVGRILARDRQGGFVTPPEEAFSRSLGKSGEAGARAADELIEASGGDPEALAAMQQYLRKQFVEAPNPGKFLTKHDELLDRFPDLKREMTDAVESGRLAGGVETAVTQGLKEAQLTPAARFADAPIHLEFEKIVNEGVRNPALAARALLREAAKDPTGKATLGVKAAALDYLMRKAKGDTTLSGVAIRRQLTDKRVGPALRAVLGKREMRRLARIANELDMIAASEGARSTGDVMNDRVNSLIEFIGTTLGARGGSQLGAGTSGASLKTASAGSTRIQKIMQGLTNNEAERMMRSAALDNKLYKMLFTPLDTPANIALVENRLSQYLAAEAGQAAEELRGREPAPAGPWSRFSPS